MIDDRRMPRRLRQEGFRDPAIARRGNDKQVRDQAPPFGNLYRCDPSWGRRHQRLTRTVDSGAGTGFTGMLGVGHRRRREIAGRIGWRSFDVGGILAAGAGRCGRKENDAQTCQRHAEGGQNQTSLKDTHQITHPTDYGRWINYDDTPFAAPCKQKIKKA